MPDFSIVTPSFNMGQWLKLCHQSISDQYGVSVEHVVQDACSTDETITWAAGRREEQTMPLHFKSETDSGMYDAINRGIERSTGDILAYLNCDEQYLPGALELVKGFFNENPEIDVVFGDVVVADAKGDFICYRKPIVPVYREVLAHSLPVLTCATFFRRRMITERNLYFDPTYKTVGDRIWILSLLQSGVRMGLLKQYTSFFTITGNNLDASTQAHEEKRACREAIPVSSKVLKHYYRAKMRVKRLLRGGYRQEPFEYQVYTAESPRDRISIRADQPTSRWPTFQGRW